MTASGSQLQIAALNLTSAYSCDAEALILSLEASALRTKRSLELIDFSAKN